MKSVLLVDDDEAFLGVLKRLLMMLRIRAVTYPASSRSHSHDCIIVSLEYGAGNPTDIIRSLRRFNACCSIFACANGATDVDIVLAHDAGADDYFEKRTDPILIEAKLRQAVRRRDQCRGIHASTLPGQLPDKLDSQLTRFEDRLLRLLMRCSGEVVPRETIARQLWGSRRVESKLLYEHISTLRNKLRCEQWTIVNVRGRGYRLESLSPRVETPPESTGRSRGN